MKSGKLHNPFVLKSFIPAPGRHATVVIVKHPLQARDVGARHLSLHSGIYRWQMELAHVVLILWI